MDCEADLVEAGLLAPRLGHCCALLALLEANLVPLDFSISVGDRRYVFGDLGVERRDPFPDGVVLGGNALGVARERAARFVRRGGDSSLRIEFAAEPVDLTRYGIGARLYYKSIDVYAAAVWDRIGNPLFDHEAGLSLWDTKAFGLSL